MLLERDHREGVGGDLIFSTGGKNYFEMASQGTRVAARFWVDMTPPARSPDATTVLARRP